MPTVKSFNQLNNISYDQRLMKQQASFLPCHSNQPSMVLPPYTGLFPTSYSAGAPYPSTVYGQFVDNSVISGFDRRDFGPRQGSTEYRPVKVKYTEWKVVNILKTTSVLHSPQQRGERINPSFLRSAYQSYSGPLVRV